MKKETHLNYSILRKCLNILTIEISVFSLRQIIFDELIEVLTKIKAVFAKKLILKLVQ